MVLVADTSSLVSLAIATDETPIRLLFEEYEIRLPPAVRSELQDIAAYEDAHADAGTRVLTHITETHIQAPTTHPATPLDGGETAAIALANELNAAVFLCDEYSELATVHALLSEPRLMTTPKMIEAFVRRGVLSPDSARTVLSEMVTERSWRNNAYVSRFLNRFDE